VHWLDTIRAARFFLAQQAKNMETTPNGHKIYRTSIKC
jgi:hypothetical protein